MATRLFPALICALLASTAWADTGSYTVNSGSDDTLTAGCVTPGVGTTCTLRGAILAANAYGLNNGLPAAIQITVATVSLSLHTFDVENDYALPAEGDLDIYNSVTISGTAGGTVIDATAIGMSQPAPADATGPGPSRVFYIGPGAGISNGTTGGGVPLGTVPSVVIFNNLEIKGGKAGYAFMMNSTNNDAPYGYPVSSNANSGGAPVTAGGGIDVEAGALTLNNCIVDDNSADLGGGIFVDANTYATTLNLFRTTLKLNSANIGGGGLAAFSSNGATPASSIVAAVNLDQSSITGNTAAYAGGGVDLFYGSFNATHSLIGENTVSQGGGASESLVQTLTDCGCGGGIASCDGAIALSNTTIYGNANQNTSTCHGNGGSGGGGIYAFGQDATITLNNVTIAYNLQTVTAGPLAGAGFGAGIYLDGFDLNGNTNTTEGASATLANTIVLANSDVLSGLKAEDDCSIQTTLGAASVSQGYNLLLKDTPSANNELNKCFSSGAATGDLGIEATVIATTIASSLSTTAATSAGAYPSPAAYLAIPSSQSPAYNGGNPAATMSAPNACMNNDQRGVSRPQASVCDIGAYEYIPVSNVSLVKTASASQVAVGQQLTYTLTVSNAGPDAASGVIVSDPLPTGVTFVSASSGCSEVGSTVSCVLAAPIAAGQSASVTITVTVDTAGTITNTGTVSTTTSGNCPNGNQATICQGSVSTGNPSAGAGASGPSAQNPRTKVTDTAAETMELRGSGLSCRSSGGLGGGLDWGLLLIGLVALGRRRLSDEDRR